MKERFQLDQNIFKELTCSPLEVCGVNKSELLEQIVKSASLNKSEVEVVLNKTIEIIAQTVSKGEEVKLISFGTFDRLSRKERRGRNPKTGASIRIPATRVPRFRPGKEFRDLLNGLA